MKYDFCFIYLNVKILFCLTGFLSLLIAHTRAEGSDLITQYERSLKESSNNLNPVYWRDLGSLFHAKSIQNYVNQDFNDNEERALIAYNKALELNRDKDKSLSADIYRRKGIAYEFSGRLKEAIINHDLAISVSPDDIEKSKCLHSKGNTLVTLGQLSEAISLYKKAIELSPYDSSIYLSLTKAYSESGVSLDVWKSLSYKLVKVLSEYQNILTYADSDEAALFWASFRVSHTLNMYV
jgi:tetratricopeptide (TPR) repeat protein